MAVLTSIYGFCLQHQTFIFYKIHSRDHTFISAPAKIADSNTVKRYGKFSKISNTFPFLFSNQIMVIRAGIHKMLARIANREDPDQTASSEAV